ncbi:hypothetical protein EOD14_08270 [Mesorhizobium sp. M7A.T.Ca.US.000.02.1.1]|uniref:hypothetical protein n=1 Tax=Mesorhizobium sp. M7A.T.Ca.US.000.02.1.1 TaxID=2496792 RepID=UPI000FD5A14C|nr:hypothetical protein [Mesorhizobium sp. M7A.T.Ca.US.000.02.1.1]RUT88018.1 hypothetical protein EOD14_08270 [Mesorhizobium sp. M7A.T.Ca.US.000.02.1.1]
MSASLSEAIKNEALRIGADPQDFATVMSYETGGTFDIWQKGPTTKWGQHRGLIQMGEPQRQKYGYYKGMSEEDAVHASANYLVDSGFKPGMGLLDLYSTINAGAPGLYDRSDAAAGGAPGTVRDKVEQQMEAHKAKAAALLGGNYVPQVANPYTDTDAPQTNYNTYDQSRTPPAPTLVDVTQQKADEAARGPQPYTSWSDQIYDSGAQNWYTAKIYRWATQGAVDPHDNGWTEDQWKHITETVPEQYHDYVLTGTSEYNRNLRLKYATEMADRDVRADKSGTASSLTAGVLSGIADPVLLPLVAAGGVVNGSMAIGRTFVTKILGGALMGGASNAALELGAKYGLDDPHTDALAAFGVGALLGGLTGPLARNPATAVERDMMTKTGLDAIEQAKARALQSNMPSVVSDVGSAGAARNTDRIVPFDPTDWGIDDAAVDRGFGGKLRFDVAGQLTTSENPRARLAGFAMFEESAGTKGHAVLDAPTSVRAVAMERKLMGNRNSVYQVALRDYVAEGSSLLNPLARARKADEFHRAVNAFMVDEHPSPDVSPHIVKAASARKQFYDAWAGELERAFPGLSVKQKGFYSPKVADHNRISELDRLVDEDTMHKFIAESIRRAHGEIEDSLLKKMAKGYWANIRKAGYGIEDSIAGALGLGDKQAFKDAFKQSLKESDGLADEDLDKVYDLFSGVVDETKKTSDGDKGVGYLKRRTVMKYDYAANVRGKDGSMIPLKMDDLFIQDAEFLDHRYARTMSGRVAFADMKVRDPVTDELIFDGIRSEADLTKFKNWVREGFRQTGKPIAEVQSKMANAIENIDFGWKRINGIPVYGQEKAYAQWVRRFKTLQFIRLMSNMGLNQVQESWKVASMTGFRASMQQLPAIRRMVDETGRSIPKRDALLGELEHMTGIGLDGLVGKFDFRFADDRIGAGAASRLANGMDMALDWGQRMTAEVSLMRGIQDYQQKWAAKAVAQHLFDMARKTSVDWGGFDLTKRAGKGKERLAAAGIGDEQAKLIFGSLLEHAERDGKKLVSLGSNKWDPKAVTEFSYLINRYTDRLVQTNDVGGLAKWMSNPVASLFTQFRSFVLGAWSKSTLYAINHMDPRMAVALVGEMAFGTATFAVRQAPQLATDEGYDKYFEETLDPVNLAKNGFARTATSSILPMLMDSALMWTPVGAQFGSARASGAPQDALFGAPAGNMVADAARFSKGVIRSTTEGREMAQSELRAGWSAFAPLGNFLPFSALFSHLIEDRRETPRNR